MWLSEHKALISASAPGQMNEREEINQLIHQVTRLELQARTTYLSCPTCRAIFMVSSKTLPLLTLLIAVRAN